MVQSSFKRSYEKNSLEIGKKDLGRPTALFSERKHMKPLFLGAKIVSNSLNGSSIPISGHDKICREERGTKVVSSGAFRFVRHPLYLACLLFYLGLAVSTVSIFSLAFFVAIFFFYNYLASFEERLLEEKFGDEYKKYRRSTGKWVPGIGKETQ